MDPQTQYPSSGSRAVYWIIGIILLAVIVGGAAWMYMNTNKTADDTSQIQLNTPDPVATSSGSIDATITDLDSDLASIDEDLASTDDDVPNL